jgi:hypothetical protein
MTPEEHRNYLMRSAKMVANSRFTAGGNPRPMRPITLPTTPWKDDGK